MNVDPRSVIATRGRALMALASAAVMLISVVGCAPRPVMAPLCEGIAYTGRALALSEEAIDALATSELGERDSKLDAARLSLAQARDRLAETDRSPDANPAAVAGLAAAIEESAAVIEQVATSPVAADVQLLRQSVDTAEGIIEAIGPPLAGCNVG